MQYEIGMNWCDGSCTLYSYVAVAFTPRGTSPATATTDESNKLLPPPSSHWHFQLNAFPECFHSLPSIDNVSNQMTQFRMNIWLLIRVHTRICFVRCANDLIYSCVIDKFVWIIFSVKYFVMRAMSTLFLSCMQKCHPLKAVI